MQEYDFGAGHPLRPVRLAQTVALISRFDSQLDLQDPGSHCEEAIAAIHTADYIQAVKDERASHGLGTGDCPLFLGIYEKSLPYCAGSVAAAKSVIAGQFRAYSIAGGLHHSQRNRASGFCIFNDCALAIQELVGAGYRVAYVDVDLHDGDGVRAIFGSHPHVLCCSIHQRSPGFYPGSGAVTDPGVNVPLPAETGGQTWRYAFENGIMAVLTLWKPTAIVLQTGCDAHFSDPLGRLRITTQDYQWALQQVQDLRLPTVVLGGGGYDLNNVARMWTLAYLTFSGELLDEKDPSSQELWDTSNPYPVGIGQFEAEIVVERLNSHVFPTLRR